MIDIKDIKTLFEKIATVHPAINHSVMEKRFYGYDAEERNEDRSVLNYPNLGLSALSKKPLSGAYTLKEMGMQDKMYITVCLLDSADTANYEQQEEIYQRLKVVMDDIVDWLYKTSFGPQRCNWPVIEWMDIENITYNNIGPVGQATAYGWEMHIAIRDLHDANNTTNPLNAMTNE